MVGLTTASAARRTAVVVAAIVACVFAVFAEVLLLLVWGGKNAGGLDWVMWVMLLLLVLLHSRFWLHLCCGLPPLPPTSSRDSSIPIFDPATTCEWQIYRHVSARRIVAVVTRWCCRLPPRLHPFRRPLPFGASFKASCRTLN